MKKWERYDFTQGDAVAMPIWGKDHWSTLAYVETRCVDHDGVIDNRHMRTHPRLHRALVGISHGAIQDGSAYPTLCKTGNIEKHDDWSCIEDMVAAGLVKTWFRVKDDSAMFGGNEVKIELMPVGQDVAGQLREWKARGGKYQFFEPNLPGVKGGVA